VGGGDEVAGEISPDPKEAGDGGERAVELAQNELSWVGTCGGAAAGQFD